MSGSDNLNVNKRVSGRSPGLQMLHGSAWLIALRWAMRLIGVISTIILARLLSPKDFGVVAIAMIVVGMFEILSWTGQNLALIRHGEPTREHYDTAWTISALIGVGIAAAVVAVAPLTSFYFHDPQSVAVIQWLSLRPLLSGLENIGTVDFQRSLRFDRVFGYNFYAKLLSFVLTIFLAVTLRSYWALVAGILVGQLARTILSYKMHAYRPSFCLTKRSEIWSFSLWTLVRSIGGYMLSQVDNVAVGGISGSVAMGRYTVAKDVASSPTEEINDPISAVLFPVMALYQNEPNQLKELFLRALGWSVIIGVSTGAGVAMVAPDMVSILLGSKWISITPLIPWLALTAGAIAPTSSSFTILDIIGKPGLGARLQWARVVLLAIGLFPVAFYTRNLVSIAAVRLGMTIIFIPSLLFTVSIHIGVTFKEYLRFLWRPVVAGAVMCVSIAGLNLGLGISAPIRLSLDVIDGILVFNAALLGLWMASGQPAAPERDLVEVYKRVSGYTTAALSRYRS